MIVNADTTPIITLIKLHQLELLENLFGSIMIPTAVYDELTINPRFEKEAEIVRECKFLKCFNVSDRQSIKFLREIVGLDASESGTKTWIEDYRHNRHLKLSESDIRIGEQLLDFVIKHIGH